MKSEELVVIDPIGLHARPTAIISNEARKFNSDLQIAVKDKSGNLKSILNVMALGVKQGDVIKIIANGQDEETAIDVIVKAFIEKKLAARK